MNLKIQKSHLRHSPSYTINNLSVTDKVQFTIDKDEDEYIFHIEIEKLLETLSKADCLQGTFKKM